MEQEGQKDKDRLSQYFDRIVKEKKIVQAGEKPVRNVQARGKLEMMIGTEIPDEGLGFDGSVKLFEALDSVSLNWKHPMFLSYFPTTISDSALIGGLIQSVYPNFNSSFDVNEEESRMEIAVTDYLCDLLKLPKKFKWSNGGVGLVLTTTGNCSVLSIHIAKHKKLQELGLGASHVPKLVGYYPAYAHSHCIKALVINGVVKARKVPLIYSEDIGNFMMDLVTLNSWMDQDKQNGLTPFVVYSALGATSCCAVDPLKEVADLCQKYGCMMVTDGAYSGAFLLNDKYKPIRESIEATDFYMINMTKTGYCGGESTVLFHNQKGAHLSSFNLGTGEGRALSEYKLGNNTKTGLMRMFFTFACLTQESFAAELKLMEDAAAQLASLLIEKNSDRFERFPPNSNFALICMRGKFDQREFVLPEEEAKMKEYKNKKNRELLTRIMKQDWLYILGAENNEQYYIRLSCNSHSAMNRDLLERLIQVFNTEYDALASEVSLMD